MRAPPDIVVLALALASACSSKNSGTDSGSCTPNSTMESDTNALISDYRESVGLGPLTLDACASELARAHSQDMADGTVPFGHDGFDDRAAELTTMFSNVSAVGENVAYMTAGYKDPAYAAYDGWLNSPPHLENIETPDFNFSAMGVAQNDAGELYFTHMLIAAAE
ncbi:MAG: CAP domain-containing protein [Oligoflexia bacterium]|nr:CAP domain-containing protein [Oligoflexia bacterium]